MQELYVAFTKLSLILSILQTALAAAPPLAPQFLDQASVRAYIASQATLYGVSTSKALYIAEKECGFGFRTGIFDPTCPGPELNGTTSWGIWQFNDANDGFDKSCAIDPVCATKQAMEWLAAGRGNKWSTWSHRGGVKGAWFKDKL